jgi:iron complex transport system substrate-binding protein
LRSVRESVGKSGFIIVILLVSALLFTACGNTNQSSNNTAADTSGKTSSPAANEAGNAGEAAEKTVTDAMGHEVKIPANPQRVLASYLEDQLVALGVTPVAQWSVANGKQDYLQSSLKDIPTINYDLPPEAVASFNPDFIIIGSESLVQKGLYEQYSKIAPTYVLGDTMIKDWRQTLLKIGELLNKTDLAKQAIADYANKAEETKTGLQEAIGGKSAAVLWLTQKQFFMVDDKLSSGEVLFKDLSMNPPNLVTELPESAKASWNPVSMEKLAQLDADYIFLVNSDKSQGTDTLNDPIWKNVPAVKEGHVYEMDSTSSWLYSGAIAGEKVMDDLQKLMASK